MLSTLRVHLLTWNVVGRDPEEDLLSALGLDGVQVDVRTTSEAQLVIGERGDEGIDKPGSGGAGDVLRTTTTASDCRPDVVAIGLQEVSARPQAVLMDTLGFEDPWSKRLRETLAPYGYVKMKSVRLQGLLLVLFVQQRHMTYVRGVQTEYTRTGLRRMWGNKGAVTIRANIYGCSVCFVNCHLAAHEGELQQRIEDYNTIVDTQVFSDPETENILYHDYVFWIGDLNFRITGHSAADIDRMARDGLYERLLETDQLMMAMKSGEAFAEFNEVRPAFKPSYKYVIGTADDYDLQRLPSWTDRILYKANPDVYENVTLAIEPERYNVHNGYVQSDHKPVSASFAFKVFQGYVEGRVQFASMPSCTWSIGGGEDSAQCHYKYCHLDVHDVSWDWIGLYKADFTSIDDYVTYVWAARESKANSGGGSDSSGSSEDDEQQEVHGDVEKRSRPLFCVTFPQAVIPTTAAAAAVGQKYRFLYVASDSGNVLGMSDPFEIALNGSRV